MKKAAPRLLRCSETLHLKSPVAYRCTPCRKMRPAAISGAAMVSSVPQVGFEKKLRNTKTLLKDAATSYTSNSL
jgi:hypothetical protein